MGDLPKEVMQRALKHDAAFWQADPHRFGPGKTHIVDPCDRAKTYCGQLLEACPGRPLFAAQVTCKNCSKFETSRREREQREAEEAAQLERDRLERKKKYHAYLQTPKWREKSDAVLRRENYICEGCGSARATQAHHVTYEHIFDEFLWELRAICKACHDRVHAKEVGDHQ